MGSFGVPEALGDRGVRPLWFKVRRRPPRQVQPWLGAAGRPRVALLRVYLGFEPAAVGTRVGVA